MSSWCWKQGDVSAIVWSLCLASRGNEQESRVGVEFCWVLKEASTREGADEAKSLVQEQSVLVKARHADLVDVVTDVHVGEGRVKNLEVCIRHVLKHKTAE